MSGLLWPSSPDLPSAGVLTYRLELRCGVLFPKLSRLLNQERALSAPCSPQAPARGGAGMLRTGLIRRFDGHMTVYDHRFVTSTSANAFSGDWAAGARVERTGARPSRAVVKRALTCGSLLPP